jgi:hypothetical protein
MHKHCIDSSYALRIMIEVLHRSVNTVRHTTRVGWVRVGWCGNQDCCKDNEMSNFCEFDWVIGWVIHKHCVDSSYARAAYKRYG